MAKALLRKICHRFHDGIKKEAADDLGVKAPCYQHFDNGRPLKDFMLVLLRRNYGSKYHRNGISDTQILDLLEQDYPRSVLNKLMSKYR